MTTILSIIMNLTGEVISTNYPYSIIMSGISETTTKQINIPVLIKINKQDLLKAGNLKNGNNKDIIRILASPTNVERATDFARSRGETEYANQTEAFNKNVIRNNIELVTSIIFKKGASLNLQNNIYSVYQSTIKEIKPKSTFNSQLRVNQRSYQAIIDLFMIKGQNISMIKHQRLSCVSKREKLRESLKDVLGYDIGPEQNKKVVPNRIFPPIQATTQRRSYPYPYPYPRRGGRKNTHNVRKYLAKSRKTRKTRKTRKLK